MNKQVEADVLDKLQGIFRDIFLDDSLVLTRSTSPEEIEEWDSLAHINILAAVEKEFGIQFTAEQMGSIGDVAGILETVPTS